MGSNGSIDREFGNICLWTTGFIPSLPPEDHGLKHFETLYMQACAHSQFEHLSRACLQWD